MPIHYITPRPHPPEPPPPSEAEAPAALQSAGDDESGTREPRPFWDILTSILDIVVGMLGE